MLITQDFVSLNFGRTGSTFVRQCIKEAERRKLGPLEGWLRAKLGQMRYKELLLTDVKFGPGRLHARDQHGIYDQIPLDARGRKIVMAVRNPFSQHVSKYEYGFWKKHLWTKTDSFCDQWPSFPNLCFDEYLRYRDWVGKHFRLFGVERDNPPGPFTTEFIQMICPSHHRVLKTIKEDEVCTGCFADRLPANLHLLRTETLTEDLYNFLLTMGYNEKDISFIHEKGKVQPPGGTGPNQCWREYYDSTTIEWMIDREKLGLMICLQLGVGNPESWPAGVEDTIKTMLR